jgi:RNA-directed DNA polymerase
VVLCRAQAVQVQTVIAAQLQALGLTLNSAKTRVLDARQQAFTFLGFTVRLTRSPRTGRLFPLVRPSAAACQRLRGQVKALTGREHLALPTPALIAAVNRVVRGWAGYFYFQHCSRDFSTLRWFLEERVCTFLRRKHRYRSRGYRAFPHEVLYGRLGLYRLPMRAPWTTPTHAGR